MTRLLGNRIIRYGQVTSTNEVLKELALDGISPGTMITSKTQTKGKGRLDRDWESPDGGLWMSVLTELTPDIDNRRVGLIPLMAGSSVANAVLMEYGLDAGVKWPNDVMIENRKVCGILCELIMHDDTRQVLIGIGINVNNRVKKGYDFSDLTTSIAEEFEKNVKMDVLENAILEELDFSLGLLANADYDKILDTWRELSMTLGKQVNILTQNGSVTGMARDIDENGALVIEYNNQIIIVNAGDCQHLV